MIELGGKTLLARAVDTLRTVQLPGADSDPAIVTVIGQRALLEGADRAITDSYPGCGPLGGIEAALNDLNRTLTTEWALFLPVDMPFLPAGLIDALLGEWLGAGRQGAMACHVVVGNRPQPLVSLIHRLLHPYISDALRAGQFRVTPVLQSACNSMASLHGGAVLSSGQRLWQTVFNGDQDWPIRQVWDLSEPQRRSRQPLVCEHQYARGSSRGGDFFEQSGFDHPVNGVSFTYRALYRWRE